jgi:molybdate transport system ATP-binding protein
VEFTELLGELVRAGQGVLVVCRTEDVPEGFKVLELSSPRPVGAEPPARSHGSRRREEVGDTLIDLQSVSVRHGGTTILRDITWTVRKGERWAVLGPNGSGKTTLLSLICGDHPQAFANHVRVFGKLRGEETLWELKRRIGLVSPELHACFPRMRTAFNAAATGFEGHLTPGPHSPEQEAAVRRLFAEFGLAEIAERPWWSISVGTQRAVLFVRAVASTPPLVILDEPFQGMDAEQVHRLRGWLDTNLLPSQTLLMVTHRADELPACVAHRLTLADGRVVEP